MAFPNFLTMGALQSNLTNPAALRELAPTERPPWGSPEPMPRDRMSPLRPRTGFRNFLGSLGDALLIATGGNPIHQPEQHRRRVGQALEGYLDNPDEAIANFLAIDPAAALQLHRQREQDRLARDRHDWQRQYQSRPQYRTVNGQVVQLDPMGDADPQVVHQAPEDFELYAESLGLEPGTDEYLNAMRDYVLRGSGPTAHQNRSTYENLRHRNRQRLESTRQTNRESLEDRRQRGRQTIQSMPARPREGAPSRPSTGGRGAAQEGAIIRNPRTGERMRLENGRWVPVR